MGCRPCRLSPTGERPSAYAKQKLAELDRPIKKLALILIFCRYRPFFSGGSDNLTYTIEFSKGMISMVAAAAAAMVVVVMVMVVMMMIMMMI
jgi:hypothetical protein